MQFCCVSEIIEKCVGCVWLKCSADSKLVQKFIHISQSIFFLLMNILCNSAFLLLNYSLLLSDPSDTYLDMCSLNLSESLAPF